MRKPPLRSPILGVDIVTGHPATTGGPYASPNPVKPHGHPLAIEAQRTNKTGPFAEKPVGQAHINTGMDKRHQDTLAAEAAAKKAREAEANNIPPSTGHVETPGTEAAKTAPVVAPKTAIGAPRIPGKQPQGMQKPTITSQHVNTSTVQPPHAVPPEVKVKLDEKGDSPTDAGTENKSSQGS